VDDVQNVMSSIQSCEEGRFSCCNCLRWGG